MFNLVDPPVGFAVTDAGDLRSTRALYFSDLRVSDRFVNRSYFADFFGGKAAIPGIGCFAGRVRHESRSVGMLDVFVLRDDLKIRESVVQLVPVKMVYLESAWDDATACPPNYAVRKALKVVTAVGKTHRRIRRRATRLRAAPIRVGFRPAGFDVPAANAQPVFLHSAENVLSVSGTPRHARLAYTSEEVQANG